MTRQEAKESFYFIVYEENEDDSSKLVDKIYDDIESIVCSNCKYFIQMGWTDFGNKCISDENRVAYTSIDFGCNKFERKTD